ncbi:MAG: trypsin-like serine protease [Synechococcaceae cyanobacterium SM2_3_1]|nr:trypsin-like serine protease [Synechococcaceae cyanobacterium SM2_3_1]
MKIGHLLLSVFSLGIVTESWIGTPVWGQNSQSIPQFGPEEQISISVYEKASPAVVTIQSRAGGSGSGSLVSPEGLVLTNEHVVRGSNGQVQVTTAQGGRFLGQVIAVDRSNDLALIRLQTNGELFASLSLADPGGIRVGQQVFAIGSPFGLSGTLTTGILSRVGSNGDLQTDAAINPGNSGGPLLNSRGELIGVNKAILSAGRGGNTGIGFATNATVASTFIAQNQGITGIAPAASGPRLGVSINTQTLVIQEIQPGSVANRIGLLPGDQILGLNGQRLVSLEQLLQTLDQSPRRLFLTINRRGNVGIIQVQF